MLTMRALVLAGGGTLRLTLCMQVPPNGLVIYTGTVMTDDGKEKKLNIDFEPFKPINTSLYLCDNKFHTEALNELLESDSKCVWAPDVLTAAAHPCGACMPGGGPSDAAPCDRYGFIVMDGNGSLFGTLSGNTREVLHKFTVDLPKKHGRGGQSALRFARLRLEKRHNYVRKVRRVAGASAWRPPRHVWGGAGCRLCGGYFAATALGRRARSTGGAEDDARPRWRRQRCSTSSRATA